VEDPDGPEVPAVEIRLPQQPESTAEPPDLASQEYRDEVIEATKAALRGRISSGGRWRHVRFGLTGEAPARGCRGQHVWPRNGGGAVAQ